MAELVSAWTEGNRTFLVQRDGDGVKIRSVAARWVLFVKGLDDRDRADLARDPRVSGVTVEGHYTRIACRNKWKRRDLVEILEKASRAQDREIEILEADVSSLRRLLSDVASLEIDPNPHLVYLDLETDSRATFEDVKAGKARILTWAIEGVDGDRASGVLEADTNLAERNLLESLFVALGAFDCILAWNGDGFDFPVIQNRAEELGVRLHGREIPWHRWTWLDHLLVFKKYNMHSDGGGEEKTSFALGHVAGYLLGEGKIDFDASRTWEAWAAGGEHRAALLRYNEQDTALLPRIEEKTGFIALHLAVCHICRVFPDTRSLNATVQGDGFLLRLGTEYGYRWPTRQHFEEDNVPAPFKGAFVMEPTRLGAIENVHVADFVGLYPAIIRTWNMSPDTKLREPRGAPTLCQLPNRETWFRTDRDGMFRIALDRLVAKRGEYTDLMKAETPGTERHIKYKRLSGAFKIVANSFYGILGSPWSRFFDVEIAEGVTQTGRWLLETVIEEAKAAGLDPFYGDTDSVFVAGDRDEFQAVVDRLNSEWSDRLAPWGITGDHSIDLDFEKTFRRLIMITAKRYVGALAWYKGKAVTADAKPEVKGLEFKRGDTLRIARRFQVVAIRRLLELELPTPASMRELVEEWKERVLEGELVIEDVILSQSLSKPIDQYVADTPPAHVRVAKILRERGEPMAEGSRVAYLIHPSTDGRMNAVPAGDEGAFDGIDRIYYWEKRIYPAVERVLEKVYPAEMWAESRAYRKQRKLESGGQTRLDFVGEVEDDLPEIAPLEAPLPTAPAPVRPSTTGPRLRRRRKRKAAEGVTVTLLEATALECGGAEKFRRTKVLEAIKAAIEANPGELPVTVLITWREIMGDGTAHVKVTIPTGLSITATRTGRRALERCVRSPDSLSFPGL